MSNKRYIVGVIGSRNYNNKQVIYDYLDSKKDKINYIVSGGCKSGADKISQMWCEDEGISILIHYPDWSKGKGAGLIRNFKIVRDSEIIIAFTTGSRGTQHSIDYANKIGKKVIIHKVEQDKIINKPDKTVKFPAFVATSEGIDPDICDKINENQRQEYLNYFYEN